jgi:hypothetical protein
MDDTLILFLTSAAFTVMYGLVWLFRKKDGGPLFGYTSSWVAMAPFAFAMGIVAMLIALFVWLAETNPP